ncbi:MAG: phosphoribosylglycinamide formyltransferase [Eubacterium sp.]|nr:phosphoribosylglycinamide formyltransferase [Eubacterium sp.]
MLNITVLVSGGGTNLQAIIDAIRSGVITNARIGCVISNNADAYALTRAADAGIDTCVISRKDHPDKEEFDAALLKALADAQTDLVVLAGYLVVLSAKVIKAYENRIVNVHPSLIPAFCGQGFYGLKVHEEVIARGCRVTGATVHFVDSGTDTGPIIMQKAVEVHEGDSPKELQQRVMEEAEWVILPRTIDLIANGCVTVEDGVAHVQQNTADDDDFEDEIEQDQYDNAESEGF